MKLESLCCVFMINYGSFPNCPERNSERHDPVYEFNVSPVIPKTKILLFV